MIKNKEEREKEKRKPKEQATTTKKFPIKTKNRIFFLI